MTTDQLARPRTVGVQGEANLDYPKLLLLTGSPPGERGVGQIIVSEICRSYPHDRLCIFATLSRGEAWSPTSEFADLPVERSERRYEKGFHQLRGPVGRLACWSAYQLLYRRHVASLVTRAVGFGRRHGCQAVVSFLESATNVDMAGRVAQGIGVPNYPLVWDDPDHLANGLYQIPCDVGRLKKAFAEVMRKGKRAAVVSEAMQRIYSAEHGVSSVILRHAAPASPPRTKKPQSDTFAIGFAGSVSAGPEFGLLLQALDSANWKINDRSVQLILFGMRFVLESKRPRNIVYKGYHSVADTVQALAEEADVLFMPQPFSDSQRTLSTLSFQTKFSTYLAARRPILLLGPPGSTVGEFMRRYSVGTWCDELNVATLLASLRTLLTDQDLRGRALTDIDAALRDEFNSEHFKRQFHRFIGIGHDW